MSSTRGSPCGPKATTDQREQDALGDELTHDPSAPCTERRPHGDLCLAPGRPDEQQVRDIGARDEEHERHGAEHRVECSPDIADDLFSERLHHPAERGVAFGIQPGESLRDLAHITLRHVDSHAWLEARDRREKVRAAISRIEHPILKPKRDPHVGSRRVVQRRGRNADDGEGISVQ
jgi:hypothetical protein